MTYKYLYLIKMFCFVLPAGFDNDICPKSASMMDIKHKSCYLALPFILEQYLALNSLIKWELSPWE